VCVCVLVGGGESEVVSKGKCVAGGWGPRCKNRNAVGPLFEREREGSWEEEKKEKRIHEEKKRRGKRTRRKEGGGLQPYRVASAQICYSLGKAVSSRPSRVAADLHEEIC
jgi:hypothetical protein